MAGTISSAESTNPQLGRRWLFGAAIPIALLAVSLWVILSGKDSPLLRDPRFVVTTRHTIPFGQMQIPGATWKDRLSLKWLEIRMRFQKPRPANHSFPPHPTNRCSIHGLLSQCTDATGIRYLIAKEVAAGSVQFGHTNTLNGTQWATAFAEALRTGQPEWWDSKTRTMRRENLVLLTNNSKMVLVLPKELALEYLPNDLR